MEVLLKLQRMGVQIFIATHDYVLLKEFEMAAETDDKISYHSLCLTDNGISHESSDTLAGLSCNPIRQAYEDILDRQLSNF